MSILQPASSGDLLPRHSHLRAAIALLGVLAVGAGTQALAQMPAPSPSATLTIGIGVDLDTVDPAQQTTTTVQNVLDYGLQTLVAFDTQGKIEPLLATSWNTSKDGLTLTFTLRQGVKFHDGTPFDAQAVAFSLERLISGKVKVPIGAGFSARAFADLRLHPYLPVFAVQVERQDGTTIERWPTPVLTGVFGLGVSWAP